MNENTVLDSELITEATKYQKFRPIPLIIELTPLLLGVIGILLKNSSLTTIAFSTAGLVYICLSWYFFKAEKFKAIDISMATISGLAISVILMGVLFYSQKWEGMEQMVTVGHVNLLFFTGLSIIFYLIKNRGFKTKPYEFTNSLKLVSRFIILLITYYLFNMDTFLASLYH